MVADNHMELGTWCGNYNPDALLTARPHADSNHDYLIPDNRREGPSRRTESIDKLIPRANNSERVAGWNNQVFRPFAVKNNNLVLYHYLNNCTIDEILKLLYTTREGIELPDRPIFLREIDETVAVRDLINTLDIPFHEYMNNEINEEELRSEYQMNVEKFVKKKMSPSDYRRLAREDGNNNRSCCRWKIASIIAVVILVVLLITVGIVIRFCSDKDCFRWIQGLPQFEITDHYVVLPSFGKRRLIRHKLGVEVLTKHSNLIEHNVFDGALSHKMSWNESGPTERVGTGLYTHDGKSYFSKFGNSSTTSSLPKGKIRDVSYEEDSPRYLVHNDDSYLVYHWTNVVHMALVPLINMTNIMNGYPLQDAIISNEDGVVLLGDDYRLRICLSEQFLHVGRKLLKIEEFVASVCHDLVQENCLSAHCEYHLIRLSAACWGVAGVPRDDNEKTVIRIYDIMDNSYFTESITIKLTEPFLFIPNVNRLQICLIHQSNLHCKVYKFNWRS